MNKKLLALLVIAVLPLMAFDCITDFSSVFLSMGQDIKYTGRETRFLENLG